MHPHRDIIVSLEKVSKHYAISHKQTFVALDSINLSIARGERIGIIGNNGAGKTTLLKIIGGITKPSHGTVRSHANIVSLLDLEAGFEPELTGYENILVNGLIIGMHKNDIVQRIPSIIRFADIGPYIHEPFYTYSAGMKFRLACAVAINSTADVLLFDEILNSGDWNFQRKIVAILTKTLKDKRLTTVICSHVPESLWSLADKYYVMQRGKIKKINRTQIRHLAVAHHKQFHKTFRTNEIEEFAIHRKKRIHSNNAE